MFVKSKKFTLRDLSEIFKGYEGKWVALSLQKDEFIVSGSGDSIAKALEKAKQNGVDDPILVRVPLEPVSYVV